MSLAAELTAICRDCSQPKPMSQMYSVGSVNLCRDCTIVGVLLYPARQAGA